jgi:CRISPR-associated protein Csb1
MSMKLTLPTLLDAVGPDRDAAGIQIVSIYKPAGGDAAKVMPAIYPGGYVIETRLLEGQPRSTVQLDSWQSQANRVEAALLRHRDRGGIRLPLFEMNVAVEHVARPIRLTSLDFPHRYADAYLRDSTVGGTRFDRSQPGSRLREACQSDATALLELDPGSLLFGAWDSHRKGRNAKFPRSYSSEIVGLDPERGVRYGGRLDPFNLVGTIDDAANAAGDWQFLGTGEKKKGTRLSEIGHGNALDSETDPKKNKGGVTISEARRLAFVSFAALDRLAFGAAGDDAHTAARAALAALALAGDRLAFGSPSVFLRSGCDLVRVSETIAFERAGGELKRYEVTAGDSLALFAEAQAHAADLGLAIGDETIVVEPIAGLRAAIEHAFLSAEAE